MTIIIIIRDESGPFLAGLASSLLGSPTVCASEERALEINSRPLGS